MNINTKISKNMLKANLNYLNYFINKVGKHFLDTMVFCKSRCLPEKESFYDIVREIISNVEIKDRKSIEKSFSQTEYEELRKKLDKEDKRYHKDDWTVDEAQNIYVYSYPLLGEYDYGRKKVTLYVKNIEDACTHDNVSTYCGILTTFIHELFHAVHHKVVGYENLYDPIREIEETMTEFSTLVFLKEMVDKKPETKWQETFKWAQESIKAKQRCLGLLPAYGFGYCLFNALNNGEEYQWIEQYNEKIGVIDKESPHVTFYKQLICPVYPYKDEKLCLELLRSILFVH